MNTLKNEQGETASERPIYRLPSRRVGTFWRLISKPYSAISLSIITITLFLAIAGPYITPHDPTGVDIRNRIIPPFQEISYLLGTDNLGRDVLSRIISGARVSILVAVPGTLLASVLGTTLGLIAGYKRGKIDTILMRLVDAQRAFPLLFLALAIVALFGPGITQLVLILGIWGWAEYGRLVRGVTLSIREREFVAAAQAIGAPPTRIIIRHIFPNLVPPIIVLSTFFIAQLIVLEGALSFLGWGIPPPESSWGRMLAEGRDKIGIAWWLGIFPGLAISVVVLAFNLVGDRLRDILDPRLRT
jgi:peptide/nickel transport system permease protein